MLRPPTLPLALLALAAGGCGGETKTVTETTTVTVAAQPTPTATTPAPADAPLPGGRAALEGSYLMDVTNVSYAGENIARVPNEETWTMQHACSADGCRVDVRREVLSGGFEDFVLDEIGDRRYAGHSTGRIGCQNGKAASARQRFSVRVVAFEGIDGRPTATRADAYLVITARCAGRSTRSVVRWRGSLQR